MDLQTYLKEQYSPTSIHGYELMIKRYMLAMGDRAAHAGYTDVLNYIGLLREQGLHPKSLRNNLFAIKIYYRYLVAAGKRNDHPCRYLYLKDRINRAIQVESLYPKELLEALYTSYRAKNPEHQQRDKIIIGLLIYQALTVLEITQLKTTDIDLENGTIRIQGNAKNKGRILNLKPNQIMLFHNYLRHDYKRFQRRQKPSRRTDYFLPNDDGLQLWQSAINRMINHNRDRQNKIIPLKIRQSVIAHLVKENNDIRIVQEFAGHRRAASTEAYKQTGLEELKAAIDKLHPLQ